MPKCKFCGEMLSIRIFQDRVFFYGCNNHKPSKVGYTNDRWSILYNDYRLSYYNGKSFLHKMNRHKNDSSKDFYSLIVVFDHELNILPENFPTKLPTLLTFS